MATYTSRSTKIYYDTDEEMWKEVNKLGAVATEKIVIERGIPDMTTTKKCSIVYYYT